MFLILSLRWNFTAFAFISLIFVEVYLSQQYIFLTSMFASLFWCLQTDLAPEVPSISISLFHSAAVLEYSPFFITTPAKSLLSTTDSSSSATGPPVTALPVKKTFILRLGFDFASNNWSTSTYGKANGITPLILKSNKIIFFVLIRHRIVHKNRIINWRRDRRLSTICTN